MFHPDGPTLFELARQAFSSTEHGYDLLAPKFDRTPFRTPDAILEAMARRVGGPRSVGAALDACCGTGAAMWHLRALCRDRVVGIDASQGMLDRAKVHMQDAPGDARVELVRGDVLDLPFEEELDLVTCVGALGHILRRDEPRFVDSIRRALVPGGRFVFVTTEVPPLSAPAWWAARGFNAVMHVRNALWRPPFIMYYLTFTWPEVRSLLDAHGFEVQMERGVFPDPYRRALLVTARRR